MRKIAFYIFMIMVLVLSSCRNDKKNLFGSELVDIPKMKIKILNTEVTQELYESIMGENPSRQKGRRFPVENVSVIDAMCFCNRLSVLYGYKPVYGIDGTTDVSKWEYIPHKGNDIDGVITLNLKANGFRLPSYNEWIYAAKGGQNYKFSGSDDIRDVAWYRDNSYRFPHPVAKKKTNGYGLYDMTGNVSELTLEIEDEDYDVKSCGGSFGNSPSQCLLEEAVFGFFDTRIGKHNVGFRIVRKL